MATFEQVDAHVKSVKARKTVKATAGVVDASIICPFWADVRPVVDFFAGLLPTTWGGTALKDFEAMMDGLCAGKGAVSAINFCQIWKAANGVLTIVIALVPASWAALITALSGILNQICP